MENLIKELKSIQKQIKNVDKHCRDVIKVLDEAAKDDEFISKVGSEYLIAVIGSIEESMNELGLASAGLDWIVEK